MSIRSQVILICIFFLFQSCNPICTNRNIDGVRQIAVPFELLPRKEIYKVGDTMVLSLNMEEYYSTNTNESFPIIENLVTYMGFAFFDSSAYRQPPVFYLGVDSFNLVLDSQDRIVQHSSGKSTVVFNANFDKEKQVLSYEAKIITQNPGFYVLNIWWDIIQEPFADYIEGCGEESYALDMSINEQLEDGRNVSMVKNDTALLRQTFDGLFRRQSISEILEDEKNYYFYVE